MQIKKVEQGKNNYMDLLLDADPDIDMINKYLTDGDLFVGVENGIVVCAAVITEYDINTCELKNITTFPEFRGRGYAHELINYLSELYKAKYQKMIVRY